MAQGHQHPRGWSLMFPTSYIDLEYPISSKQTSLKMHCTSGPEYVVPVLEGGLEEKLGFRRNAFLRESVSGSFHQRDGWCVVSQSVSKSASQSVSQSVRQPVTRSDGQTVSQSARHTQLFSQLASQLVSQLLSWSLGKLDRWSVCQPVSQSVGQFSQWVNQSGSNCFSACPWMALPSLKPRKRSSYRLPISETSATALCGSTGIQWHIYTNLLQCDVSAFWSERTISNIFAHFYISIIFKHFFG